MREISYFSKRLFFERVITLKVQPTLSSILSTIFRNLSDRPTPLTPNSFSKATVHRFQETHIPVTHLTAVVSHPTLDSFVRFFILSDPEKRYIILLEKQTCARKTRLEISYKIKIFARASAKQRAGNYYV